LIYLTPSFHAYPYLKPNTGSILIGDLIFNEVGRITVVVLALIVNYYTIELPVSLHQYSWTQIFI